MTTQIMQPQVQQLTQNASRYVTWASQLSVANAEQYTQAGEGLKKIKVLRAQADELFDPAIKAAHDAHKKMVALKKTAVAPLDEAESIVKGKVGAYLIEAEKARKKAEAAAQAEADRQAKVNGIVAPVVVVPKGPEVEGVSTRAKWTFEVTDEALVKREYLCLDVAKIKKVVAAMGPDAEGAIGGIKVRQEQVVVVRK